MLLFFLIKIFYLFYLSEGNVIQINLAKYNASSYCGIENENITFVNHTPFQYTIKEEDLCTGEIYILNYVQSSSDHFDRRMLIRETFGSLKYIEGEPVKLVFVVGMPRDDKVQKLIQKESENYRDIVQANFVDTYHNLTLKHIVALHWIHNFCPQARFITKSDDDTFVNNIWLLTYLQEQFTEDETFILGEIFADEVPIRKKGYKWTVSKQLFKKDKYPPYMKGFGYIISRKTIEPLLVCSYYQKYFYIDDVFISGIVAESAGINLKNFDKSYSFTGINNDTVKTDLVDIVFLVGHNEINYRLWKEIWKRVLLLLL